VHVGDDAKPEEEALEAITTALLLLAK